MGIVNVTPDSFSDGGQLPRCRARHRPRPAAARGGRRHRRRRRRIDAARAPRRSPLDEELRARDAGGRGARARGRRRCRSTRMKPEVMRAAIAAGCAMVNDVERASARRARSRRWRHADVGVCRHAHAGHAADDAAGPALRRRRAPRWRAFLRERARRARGRGRRARAHRRSTRASASARRSSTTSRCFRGLPRARRAGLSGARRAVAQAHDRRDHRARAVGERAGRQRCRGAARGAEWRAASCACTT